MEYLVDLFDVYVGKDCVIVSTNIGSLEAISCGNSAANIVWKYHVNHNDDAIDDISSIGFVSHSELNAKIPWGQLISYASYIYPPLPLHARLGTR